MTRGALESRGHGSAVTAPWARASLTSPPSASCVSGVSVASVKSAARLWPALVAVASWDIARQSVLARSGVAARELCRNSAVENGCGNRPEIGHAPLDDSHPWCPRFVACPFFRCGRPGEIWSGRGAGSRGGIFRGDIRRLPAFLQAPSPQRIASIGWPPQRRRCAHRTARCGRRASTRGERRSRTDGISRPAASAVLA